MVYADEAKCSMNRFEFSLVRFLRIGTVITPMPCRPRIHHLSKSQLQGIVGVSDDAAFESSSLYIHISVT